MFDSAGRGNEKSDTKLVLVCGVEGVQRKAPSPLNSSMGPLVRPLALLAKAFSPRVWRRGEGGVQQGDSGSLKARSPVAHPDLAESQCLDIFASDRRHGQYS